MAPPSTSSSSCQRELCRPGLKTLSDQTLSAAGLVGTGDGKLCRTYLPEIAAPWFLCRHKTSSVLQAVCPASLLHTVQTHKTYSVSSGNKCLHLHALAMLCKKISHEIGEREQAGKLMASTRLWGWLWKQRCHVSRHVFPSPR